MILTTISDLPRFDFSQDMPQSNLQNEPENGGGDVRPDASRTAPKASESASESSVPCPPLKPHGAHPFSGLSRGLPDRYVVTPDINLQNASDVPGALCVSAFLQRLKQLCVSPDIQMVLFRAPALSSTDYEALAKRVVAVTSVADCALVLHNRPRLAARLRADGVHFSWRCAATMKRESSSSLLRAVSCHTLEEVRHAEQSGFDFCVLGPVFATASHPETKPMGADHFSGIVRATRIPVYAIGGMTPGNIAAFRQSGAQGIAGIGCFWGDAAATKENNK